MRSNLLKKIMTFAATICCAISPGFNPERKYVYMKTELPDETSVREWYFRGSTNRADDEQLIESFKNAILE